MMRQFRKQPVLGRHRRMASAEDRPASTVSYYSRRSDEAINTGRNQPREKRRNASLLARFWLNRFGLLTLLVTAAICLADVMSLSTKPVIVPITTDTNLTIHGQAEYQSAASA